MCGFAASGVGDREGGSAGARGGGGGAAADLGAGSSARRTSPAASARAAATPANPRTPPLAASPDDLDDDLDDDSDSDGDGSTSSSSSDDEETKNAKFAKMAVEAKEKGNAAFASGDYAKAAKQFTMAIRFDKTNHVLFSNRSAAYSGCGKYEEALADANRCVKMAPKWGKGYGRKGAALTGLGQGGEAVKAYLAGLAIEPDGEALRAGLAEAKAKIREGQAAYEKMWGERAPAFEPVEIPETPPMKPKQQPAPPPPPPPAAADDAAAAPSAANETPPPPPLTPDVAAITTKVNALDKAITRAWLDAAKAGDVDAMEGLHLANPEVLYAWGKGISLGFTGNSAMHWAASKGHADVVRWLLRRGLNPDVRNNADSTPLHSAAGAGRLEVIETLLVDGGADASAKNGLEETPRDVALARREGGGDAIAAAIDLHSRVGALLGFGAENLASEAPMKLMRATLQLTGIEKYRSFAEKSEVVNAVKEYLGTLPARVVPETEDGKWLPMPSLLKAAQAQAQAQAPAESPPPEVVAPASLSPRETPTRDADDGSSSSSDDEETKNAKFAKMAVEAKEKGNAAFASGDYAKAAKQFTMAIRFDKTNHVLFSNRSAAYSGCGKYEEALADANRCVKMAPKWGKGYGRKGAALTGLGQGGEAVKAYLAGLAIEPDGEALRAGLADAKAAIRSAQDRYKEMWGKDVPQQTATEAA